MADGLSRLRGLRALHAELEERGAGRAQFPDNAL
jgi:hypothetical protein